jgi:hypothetical protein
LGENRGVDRSRRTCEWSRRGEDRRGKDVAEDLAWFLCWYGDVDFLIERLKTRQRKEYIAGWKI